MKAIVYRKYGSPDVLSLEEVDKPIPRDDEVLIKIHATSINSYDVDLLNRLRKNSGPSQVRGFSDPSRRGAAAGVNPSRVSQRRVGRKDACMATGVGFSAAC